MKERVAVLGANDKPSYAHIAFKMLKEYGHTPLPVNPTLDRLDGEHVHKSLAPLIDSHVDTLTLYVSPQKLEHYVDQIISLHPKRVIFNPGTESPEIEQQLEQAGIKTMRACTLVMLRTESFEVPETTSSRLVDKT
jgi:predicted CoA-binding protein